MDLKLAGGIAAFALFVTAIAYGATSPGGFDDLASSLKGAASYVEGSSSATEIVLAVDGEPAAAVYGLSGCGGDILQTTTAEGTVFEETPAACHVTVLATNSGPLSQWVQAQLAGQTANHDVLLSFFDGGGAVGALGLTDAARFEVVLTEQEGPADGCWWRLGFQASRFDVNIDAVGPAPTPEVLNCPPAWSIEVVDPVLVPTTTVEPAVVRIAWGLSSFEDRAGQTVWKVGRIEPVTFSFDVLAADEEPWVQWINALTNDGAPPGTGALYMMDPKNGNVLRTLEVHEIVPVAYHRWTAEDGSGFLRTTLTFQGTPAGLS